MKTSSMNVDSSDLEILCPESIDGEGTPQQLDGSQSEKANISHTSLEVNLSAMVCNSMHLNYRIDNGKRSNLLNDVNVLNWFLGY